MKKDLPKTLNETFDFLEKEKFDGLIEWLDEDINTALGQAHHGLGQWIRNNFGLWGEKSELRDWFKEKYFLDQADDISSIILINYHERKNNNEPDLDKHIDLYHKHWSKVIKGYDLKLRNFKIKKLCTSLNKQ